MKLFFRFLLALAFLLSGGYGHSYALHESTVRYLPENTLHVGKNLVHASFQKQQVQTVIRASLTDTEDGSDEAGTNEVDEDDEQVHVKKSIKSGYCFIAFSDKSGLFQQGQKSFSKHFSYISSHRYILLRVIRI